MTAQDLESARDPVPEMLTARQALARLRRDGRLEWCVITEKLDLRELISTEDRVALALVFTDCRVSEISACSVEFERNIAITGCTIDKFDIYGTYFLGGFHIANNKVKQWVQFMHGNHGILGGSMRLAGNVFHDFVDFEDAGFLSSVSIVDNRFEKGTNLLADIQLAATFTGDPEIRGNTGDLSIPTLFGTRLPANTALQTIRILEDREDFDRAFDAYVIAYKSQPDNYQVWEQFYFFLWTAIEDAPSRFHDQVNLREHLKAMFDDGMQRYSDRADFNFIAGYTVSIFPYEYGDYENLEEVGIRMLGRAADLEPDNVIYRLINQGGYPDSEEYKVAVLAAAPVVLATYCGNGFLNKYFRQVLYRV